jgi:hypothetical protein
MDRKASWLSFRPSFVSADTVAGVALVMMVAAFAVLMLQFHRLQTQPASAATHPSVGPSPAPQASASAAPLAQPANAVGPTPTARAAIVASTRPRPTARPSSAATPAPTAIVPLPTTLPTDTPPIPTPTPSVTP